MATVGLKALSADPVAVAAHMTNPNQVVSLVRIDTGATPLKLWPLPGSFRGELSDGRQAGNGRCGDVTLEAEVTSDLSVRIAHVDTAAGCSRYVNRRVVRVLDKHIITRTPISFDLALAGLLASILGPTYVITNLYRGGRPTDIVRISRILFLAVHYYTSLDITWQSVSYIGRRSTCSCRVPKACGWHMGLQGSEWRKRGL